MARLTQSINQNDHVQGSPNASVELVEYGDFQCPYCRAAFPIIHQVVRKLGDRVQFAFRNFPLSEMHEYAQVAAEAAEAAAAQGKFWEMHDTIYSNQDDLDVDHLSEWARSIGLNMEQFKQDLTDRAYEGKVREDFMSGVRSGVNGTPTLFINGQRYDGPVERHALLDRLNEAAEIAQA